MAKHIQETNIKTIGGESIIGTGDIPVPNLSNLEIIRKESRGSATYDFGLTELTSEESSSQLRIGFYDKNTNSYFASAPVVSLYKNDSSALNYLEVLIGDETVGTNLIKITPSETKLGNQVVYQNPYWELEDNTIPHWKAVTDYVDSKPTGATSLQGVTTGTGKNISTNAVMVSGENNKIPSASKKGIILDGYADGTYSIGAYKTGTNGTQNGGINFMSNGNMVIFAAYGSGNHGTITLGTQTTETAGVRIAHRVSGQEAINSNEFVTKAQLDVVQNNAVTLNTAQTITVKKIFQTPNATTGNAVSPIEVKGGNGATVSNSTGTVVGGNAGNIDIIGGRGGNAHASSGTNIGGNGANIAISAGPAGTSSGPGTILPGQAGNVVINAGDSSHTIGVAGDLRLSGGHNLLGTAGSIFIMNGIGSGGNYNNPSKTGEKAGNIFLGVNSIGDAAGNVIIGGFIGDEMNFDTLTSNGKRLEVRGTASFTGTVVGANGVEADEFVTKSQLDSVKNEFLFISLLEEGNDTSILSVSMSDYPEIVNLLNQGYSLEGGVLNSYSPSGQTPNPFIELNDSTNFYIKSNNGIFNTSSNYGFHTILKFYKP